MDYYQNIMKRAQYLRKSGALNSFDKNLVKIYKNNFGRDYSEHISNYFDRDKINITYNHFCQIIDLLVLFYDEHTIYKESVYAGDMNLFMRELEECGYYFNEDDVMYCIQYRFYIPNFKIFDTNTNTYKKLKEAVSEDIINDGKFPHNYVKSIDDPLIQSYSEIKDCKTVSQLKDMFKNWGVKPNENHLYIFHNNIKKRRGNDYKKIINFFNKHNIHIGNIARRSKN